MQENKIFLRKKYCIKGKMDSLWIPRNITSFLMDRAMKQLSCQFHKISFHIRKFLACNAEKPLQLKIKKEWRMNIASFVNIYIYIYIYIDLTVQIIDYCDPNDQERREDFWIYHLDTLYPKGLNNKKVLRLN